MSKLSQGGNTRYNNQVRIGEFVSVMVGDTANTGSGTSIANTTYGDFVACNGLYSQASYPDLYAQIGLLGYNSSIYTPVTWTSTTAGTASSLTAIVYGNGLFLCGGYSTGLAAPSYATSTNGINWTSRTPGSFTQSISTLAYGQGIYVIGGPSSLGRSSTDAINWTTITIGPGLNVQSMTYGNGLFVAVGQTSLLCTSTDGVNWNYLNFGTFNKWAVTYGNGLFVHAGDTGTLFTSTNGTNWTSRTTGTTSLIYSLTYGNGIYVLGTATGGLSSSTDAINWTTRTSGTTSNIRCLAYANSLYVYGGVGGVLSTSTDAAITWTSRTSGTTSTIFGLLLGSLDLKPHIFVGGTGTAGAVISYSSVIPETYNSSTQFFVPDYYNTTLTVSTSTLYSNAVFRTYVRAK